MREGLEGSERKDWEACQVLAWVSGEMWCHMPGDRDNWRGWCEVHLGGESQTAGWG